MLSEQVLGLGSRSAPVLEALRARIDDGRYAVGSRMPSEVVLCKEFEVSRSTVRKAVACLVEEGRLTVRHGAGMFVLAPAEAQVASAQVAVMGLYDGSLLAQMQAEGLRRQHLLCTFSQLEVGWDPEMERMFLEQVREQGCRALMAFLTPLAPQNDALVSELADAGMRVVHVGMCRPELPRESFVLPDYQAAGQMAATRFMLAGCRSYFMARTCPAPYEVLMERGFAGALNEHGPGFDPQAQSLDLAEDTVRSDAGFAELVAALREAEKPLGVFCATKAALWAIQRASTQLGLRTPQEVQPVVLSFDTPGPVANKSVDRIEVGRRAMVLEALEALLAPQWREVRKLVAPKLVRV